MMFNNNKLAILSVCLGFVCFFQFTQANLIIGTFNIQSLGSTKMSRPDFVSMIVKILARFDIVVIQEIKDSTGSEVIVGLSNALNEHVADTGIRYEYVISPRLGLSTYKEQLAFLYR